MDNNNNEIPPVEPSAPEPQMEQPAPVQPVVEQPAVEEPVPQPALQPVAQPVADQPIEQPVADQANPQPVAEQPVVGQTDVQPVTTAQPVEQPVAGPDTAGAKKKKGLIIGCCVGVGIAIVALVAVLLVFFLKGGEKIVSCTMETSVMGIEMKNESNIKIRDGEIYSANVVTNVNLKSLRESYRDYEDQLVESVVDSLKRQCTDNCELSRDYVAGEYLKLTMEYVGEGTEDVVYTYGIEGKSAQEIADKVQESMEKTSGTTCKQS